jgi:hypothetical protein
VNTSLEEFKKYERLREHEPTKVTIWGDVEEMMERTNFNRMGKDDDIDWSLEVAEGWVPYNSFSSHFVESNRNVVYTCDPPPTILKEKCGMCRYHFGPEGAYTLGQCGHNFHVTCIASAARGKSSCPICRSPISTRFYEVMGMRDVMPPGHEFNRWNLPLDQLPKKLHNFREWGKALEWDSSTSKHQLIMHDVSETDPLLWMTRDYEVEIRARDIEDSEQREMFCRNFGGHWSTEHNRFFRFPPKRVEKGEDGLWHEVTSDIEFGEEYKKYDDRPIGRALVLAKLEEAAHLRISTKEESFKDADCTFWEAVEKFESRIKNIITHWTTMIKDPKPELLVSITAEDSFVKDVVGRIEEAMKIFRSKNANPPKKRKRDDGNESDDSWMSGNNREIAAVDQEYDEGGRIARPSQRPRTRSIANTIDTEEHSVAM